MAEERREDRVGRPFSVVLMPAYGSFRLDQNVSVNQIFGNLPWESSK